AWAASAVIGPRKNGWSGFTPHAQSISPVTTVDATTPPTRPSMVFDAEMWVRNFVRPKFLPTRYAPVSYDQTANTRRRIQPRSAPSTLSGASLGTAGAVWPRRMMNDSSET